MLAGKAPHVALSCVSFGASKIVLNKNIDNAMPTSPKRDVSMSSKLLKHILRRGSREMSRRGCTNSRTKLPSRTQVSSRPHENAGYVVSLLLQKVSRIAPQNSQVFVPTLSKFSPERVSKKTVTKSVMADCFWESKGRHSWSKSR